ncbi:ZIP family metal transporter [Gymnodinialimonas ceratoperidinii]|uniref:Divalent cation transporter n=1 Tax=Gymnodinialimonas ceratoperidinii TaxID=2856823 RepID=A0A8F6TWX8_9RHOB|nr:divalent cation transporter [Gymnodinialimonas ceratoperidinii]QXT40452.1 divalent cation transporter [Gymnodinialimonas ceratoperidinii]
MEPLFLAIVLAGVAGLSMPLGAWLATLKDEPEPINHAITAFGGGALVSAVALVLVPDGAEHLPGWLSCLLLLLGGLVFFIVDKAVSKSGGAGALLLAMLLDYLPEAAALGAMIVIDRATAWVLAAIIFLQNLPEGYSAFREILASHTVPKKRGFALFIALALIGPVCAVIGLTTLADQRALLGGIMIFAAGGILYLVFQDVAPSISGEGEARPALGAVAGFALGLAGHLAAG